MIERNVKCFLVLILVILTIFSIISEVSSQNDNTKGPLKTPIIEVDKSTGEQLSHLSSVSTLTTEQTAKIQEKKKSINESLIHFRSGYSIYTSPIILNASIAHSNQSIQKLTKSLDNTDNYYLIQFYDDLASVDKETRDTLEQLGVTLFDYVPNNAFYAKIPLESF